MVQLASESVCRVQTFFAEGEEGATKDTPLFIINGGQSTKPGNGKGTWTLFRPLAQAAAQRIMTANYFTLITNTITVKGR